MDKEASKMILVRIHQVKAKQVEVYARDYHDNLIKTYTVEYCLGNNGYRHWIVACSMLDMVVSISKTLGIEADAFSDSFSSFTYYKDGYGQYITIFEPCPTKVDTYPNADEWVGIDIDDLDLVI